MDVTALYNLSYGLFIIGAKDGERNVGCIVNTVIQTTSKPLTVSVAVNRNNFTNGCIKNTGQFAVSILSERTKESTFGIFGFSSSRDRNKFDEVPFALTPAGLPYINEGIAGYMQCKVINAVENFSHTLFIAEVQEAENVFKEPPMTYDYYHRIIKGKTPKNASTYTETTQQIPAASRGAYVCSVCGYEHPGTREVFDQLPDDYHCPICNALKKMFAYRG